FLNTSEERLVGRPRAERLGRILWEVVPSLADPRRRSWREYHRLMRERVPVQFDEYYDAEGLWISVSAFPTRDGGMAAFLRDVTARKRAEELQDRLLGVVGHDLRNPLTAVRVGVRRVAEREALPVEAQVT